MPTTKMYEGRAVIIDPNEYPNGWENADLIFDFLTAAIEECHHCLPEDWYVEGYYAGTAQDGDNRTIVVGLERYKRLANLQPLWNFVLTADPVDLDDTQWIVFDVVRWQPTTLYNFQLP